jgi:hypothetical protein
MHVSVIFNVRVCVNVTHSTLGINHYHEFVHE